MKFKMPKCNIPPNILEKMFLVAYALRDNEHWAVFIYLMEHGDPSSLTEIRKEFDSTYWEMRPILEDLVVGGLVEQFSIYDDEWMDLDKRYYRGSIAGYRL